MAEVETEVVEVQSNILSDNQLENILDGKPAGEDDLPEVKLPSDGGDNPEDELEALKAKIAELEKQSDENTPEPTPDLVSEYVAKYQEQGGELSEADYTELAAKGYSKEFVDTYVQGLNAKVTAEQQARVKELAEPYGGEAALQEAIGWAKESWEDADKKAFNDNITNGDPTVQKLLIASLMREYGVSKQTAPTPNKPIHSNSAPAAPSKGYETKSDMMKDMADKRYRTDAGFNSAVQKKLMDTDQSTWYGGKLTSL